MIDIPITWRGISTSPQPLPPPFLPSKPLLKLATKPHIVSQLKKSLTRATFHMSSAIPYVECHPTAGKPDPREYETEQESRQRASGAQPWAPFTSFVDWDHADWLMTSGVSQTKIDDLLKRPFVSATHLFFLTTLMSTLLSDANSDKTLFEEHL